MVSILEARPHKKKKVQFSRQPFIYKLCKLVLSKLCLQELLVHPEMPGVNELRDRTPVDLKSEIKNVCHVCIAIWDHFERCHCAQRLMQK